MQNKFIWLLLVLTLILTSCGHGKLFGPTITPSPTSTSTFISTLTPTVTSSPTITSSPIPTYTPTLNFPLLNSTPIPGSLPVIGLDNYRGIIQLSHYGGTGDYHAVTWSPDGKLLAVASTMGIYLYDASTLEQVNFLNSNSSIQCVAYSPDGQTLAAGLLDGTVRLWRVSDGKLLQTLAGHADYFCTVAFSPDGTLLVSGSEDGTILIWQMPSGHLQMSMTSKYGAEPIALTSPQSM